MVKVCILFAAGTNCNQETAHAFELVGAQAENVHVNALKARTKRLQDHQVLVIPGGFSYGDYIASGKILANELVHNLKNDLLEFHATGKPILGICNGFQVLVKAGMLPAFDALFEPQTVTLVANDSGKFECRWVRLRAEPSPSIFTKGLEALVQLPVAHAEGKFIAKDETALDRLEQNHQVVFRYVDADGEPAAPDAQPGSSYPDNPNGSSQAIAGICDPSGLIFGLMPHPERFVRETQHPSWHRHRLTKPDGIAIFRNVVEYAKTEL